MSTDDVLRLAFAGLHPNRVRSLVDEHGSVSRVVAAIDSGSVDVGQHLLSVIECRNRVSEAELSFDVAEQSQWAAAMSHVEDPPLWLFRRGRLDRDRRVAIVGTRQCTEYGRRLAFELAAACSEAGWVIVSGLARGIDGAAHRGALAVAGSTVAVLGCGVDVPYPRQHVDLKRDIVDRGGAVITEYPPGTSPLAWRFPPRNRIIAGLSTAVVVVESAATGGSLSTAARAVSQARMVFAVPGDIDRPASVGCNLLIRDGAVPVLGAQDLVEGLSLVGG